MVILICINNSTNMQTASDFPHGLWGEDLTGQNDNFAFPASDILFLCREHHSLSFSSVISPGLDCKGEKRKTSTELTGRLQLDEHCEKTNQFDVNPLPPQICWSIQIELFSTGLRNKPLLDQERHQHQSEFRLQPCFQSNLTKPRVDLQVNRFNHLDFLPTVVAHYLTGRCEPSLKLQTSSTIRCAHQPIQPGFRLLPFSPRALS